MFFCAKLNVYRYLSVFVNFLDKVQSHGVYICVCKYIHIIHPDPIQTDMFMHTHCTVRVSKLRPLA
jgi:hypothetical protein